MIEHLEITAKLDNLSTMRDFVEQQAKQFGANERQAFALILSVDEAATNVINYGYRGNPGLLEIDVEREQETLIVTLKDSAPAFDPTTIPAPDVSLPLEARQPGGLGIHFIRQFLDKFSYQRSADGKNILTMKKYLTKGEKA